MPLVSYLRPVIGGLWLAWILVLHLVLVLSSTQIFKIALTLDGKGKEAIVKAVEHVIVTFT